MRPDFSAGKPAVLFEGQYERGLFSYHNYDVIPDGQHFVMIQAESARASTQIDIVINWFQELERLVPHD
jgi:hypothetical protein